MRHSAIASALAEVSLEAQTPAAVEPITNFLFYPTLGQESLVEQIITALEAREGLACESIALESQQQDHHQSQQDLKAQYEDLMAMVNPTAHTGSVQIFLLDEAGLANGHPGSHAALRAVVTSSLRDSRRVVAALTSSWNGQVENTPQIVRQRGVLRNFLLASGIRSFESQVELVEHLNAL